MEATNSDLLVAVLRVEAKLDFLVDAKFDHEVRIKSLEKARQYVVGFTGAIGAGLALIFGGSAH